VTERQQASSDPSREILRVSTDARLDDIGRVESFGKTDQPFFDMTAALSTKKPRKLRAIQHSFNLRLPKNRSYATQGGIQLEV
jgi:hypothetical protein